MKYFLNNQTWSEITREERYFCAELFYEIRNNPIPFLSIIGRNNDIEYELGYEVCLYRDVSYSQKRSIKSSPFPQKRTFDLALFSDEEIIIIEAKANQGFDNQQLNDFKKDKELIMNLFQIDQKEHFEISLIALVSSRYRPSPATKEFFSNSFITWKKIAEIYPDRAEIFYRADSIYNR